MEEEFATDIMTLIDENNEEHEFEVLDTFTEDERTFLALLPTSESESEGDAVYFIFEQIVDENGEKSLMEVDDEDLLDKIADIFQSRFAEIYDKMDDEVSET